MNKKELSIAIKDKYLSFLISVHELTEKEYSFCYLDKWTAAQQLEHIILATQPLVQIFEMPVEAIEQSFGRTNRQNASYEDMIERYIDKLDAGGQAPSSFIPKFHYSREQMLYQLNELITTLAYQIVSFSDSDLDTLLVPHPLLESITLREMLYNTMYHVEHHQNQMLVNLEYCT